MSRPTSFRVVCLVAMASGMASLAHELVWTRRVLDVIGSSATSSARVFGCFLLGLSLGAMLATRLVTRIRQPLRALAATELGIALLALPMLFLTEWSDWLWPFMGQQALAGALGWWVKLLVCLVAVLPPSLLMGITLPLMLAAALGGQRQVRRHGIWIYALNTLGGVAGILCIVFWALPAFGVDGSLLLAMAINGATAVVVFVKNLTSETVVETAPVAPVRARPEALGSLFALLSGAGIVGTEVIALRLMTLVTTMSLYSPAAVLATVVFFLALASALTIIVLGRLSPAMTIAVASLVGGLLLTSAPILFMTAAERGYLAGTGESVREVSLTLWLGLAAIFGPGLLAAGCVFPALIAQATSSSARAEGAARVAWLLACNGIGGLVGAELTNGWMLPALGPHQSAAAIGLLYGAVGLVATLRWLPSRKGLLMLALSSMLTVAVLARTVLARLPTLNPNFGFSLIAEQSDRHATLAVVSHERMGCAIIMNNQYVLGSTAARFDQARQAHVGLLFHPYPRRVGFIGLATGATAGAALLHEGVEQIDVAELSEGVVEAARRYFRHVNRNALESTQVNVVAEDGRTWIAASPDTYDVIVGDLFLPWSAGVGRLYSREHFRAVRAALRDGGVFCQWLPAYQFTREQLAVVVSTLRGVFPDVHLFRSTFHPDRPALALVAFANRRLDWDVVRDRSHQLRQRAGVRDPAVRHLEAAAMLYLGTADATSEPARVNTLANAWFELDAARERLTDGTAKNYLHGQAWNEFLRDRIRQMKADSTIPEAILSHTRFGFLLTNWEIAERIRHPQRETLAARVAAGFPHGVRADAGANWSAWPGSLAWRGRGARP